MKSNWTMIFRLGMCLMLVLCGLPLAQAQAAPTELFISEYVEGTSNNKAIEIYNGVGAAVDLAAGVYKIDMYFNGATTPGYSATLTGSIADGDVYVVTNSSASQTIKDVADLIVTFTGWFNGNDAVVLSKNGVMIDVIGQIGFNPGAEWGSGLTSTADNTLRRKSTICAGDPIGSDAFDPSLEWDGYATDTFDGLGSHTVNCPTADDAPTIASTNPASGATDFPIGGNLSVTFSEAVNLTSSWFTLSCSLSGSHTAVASGGPVAYTLNPDADFTDGESCTLTVLANQVSDVDTDDPPDHMTADYAVIFTPVDLCVQTYTHIYDIQGSGSTTPIPGPVITQGVVVGDYEGASPNLRGFYLQDATGDGNPSTSDGVFVFNGNSNSVSLGDLVRVSGVAEEYQGQTQISSVTSITACGTGSVAPTDMTLPFADLTVPEQYEGMLVRFPQTLFVTNNYYLGRFGEVEMSSSSRLLQPTNVAAPGAPALAVQAANNLNRIIVDDELNNQNPDPIRFGGGGTPLSASNTLRGGDSAAGMLGVMTYTWSGNSASGNAWRLRPINALGGGVPNFQPSNPRPAGGPGVWGSTSVASFNLLNYFNTFDSCTLGLGGEPTSCRGAENQLEFDRQQAKLVAALTSVYADVIGLSEIENDGYGAGSAIQSLVDALNAVLGDGAFAFIDADARTGQVNALGADAIKVALIYRPAVLTPVGQTAVLNTTAFVNGGDSAARNRPSLAQAFQRLDDGAVFIVDVNHLKSKGSACDLPDQGDGQGNCSDVRTNAANAMAAWLAGNPTGAGDGDVLILGDLNSYTMEDPLSALKTAGYTDLITGILGPDAYSYSFDGQWGILDQALYSPSLSGQVVDAAIHHINADEPGVLDYNTNFKSAGQMTSLYSPDMYRSSDHDLLLIGLQLKPPAFLWLPVIMKR